MPKHLGLPRTILEHVECLGYAVEVPAGDGRVILSAVDLKTGELFTVGAALTDSYTGACELAEQIGIDLEDGWNLERKGQNTCSRVQIRKCRYSSPP